jgi:hypothetical protein
MSLWFEVGLPPALWRQAITDTAGQAEQPFDGAVASILSSRLHIAKPREDGLVWVTVEPYMLPHIERYLSDVAQFRVVRTRQETETEA